MGIDTSTFHIILEAGFGRLWSTQPIPRPDMRTIIQPRTDRRSLDAAGGLGLVLHWLSSMMRQISLQQIFALIPSTVSRYLRFGLSILLEVLRHVPQAAITWPQGEEFLELSGYVSTRHPLLQGVFGSIYGLNLPCQVSSDVEVENATYNGWLHSHFISSVIVSSSKGSCLPDYAHLADIHHIKQERSLVVAQIVLAAGTIRVSLREYMKSWNTRHQMATASSLIPHFPQAMIGLAGKYLSRSKLVSTYLTIPPSGSIHSNSHGPYSRIVKLQNGGCESYREVSDGFEYPWRLNTWKRGPTSSSVVSAFTTFTRDWLESTISRMSMFLHGARVVARGSGRDLRIFYFLTNGNTIVSGPFMCKKNGIKKYLMLI